jgi:hypothetical protein
MSRPFGTTFGDLVGKLDVLAVACGVHGGVDVLSSSR